MCGEKLFDLTAKVTDKGSPPRMRGKEPDTIITELTDGITPAYAGKRQSWTSATWLQRDHPRVCGEKAVCWPLVWIIWGSPPRVRGKAGRALEGACIPGITPAYGGKDGRTSTGGLDVGITPACAGKSARRQAGPPGPAPPPQMRLGWSPPPCTGRQCRTRKSTHARRARIPVPAHTPAPQ